LFNSVKRIAVSGSVFAVAMAGGVLATSGPAMAAANPCNPLTNVYASGSTIHFNGFTSCANATGFELQIAYNMIGGSSHYSNILTCRGPLAGGTTTNEQNCGFNGIYATLTDNKSGSQRWCMNTHIKVGSPESKNLWSVAECINH
jgi:hypothetical protein